MRYKLRRDPSSCCSSRVLVVSLLLVLLPMYRTINGARVYDSLVILFPKLDGPGVGEHEHGAGIHRVDGSVDDGPYQSLKKY